MTEAEIVYGLRRQHATEMRLRYDGHNRRSIRSSLRRLRHRRVRRAYGARLRSASSSVN